MATQMMTPPQLPDWDKIRNNGDWQSIAPFLQQEKNALAAQGQNMDLAKMLFEQQQQRFPLELQKENALIDMHKAQARASNANAAINEDALKVLPPQEQRLAYNILEMRQKSSEQQNKLMDNAFQQLSGIVSAAESNKGIVPLELLNSIPEEYRSLISQPNGVANTKKLLNIYALTQPKHIQKMAEVGAHEAAANSRNAATIAAQKEMNNARLTAKDKKVGRLDEVNKQIVKGTNAFAAATAGAAIIDSMLDEVDPADTERIKVLQAEKARFTQLAEVAKQRENDIIARKAVEAAMAQGVAITSKIDAAGGNRPPNATGAIQPNPAAQLPNQTNKTRMDTDPMAAVRAELERRKKAEGK